MIGGGATTAATEAAATTNNIGVRERKAQRLAEDYIISNGLRFLCVKSYLPFFNHNRPQSAAAVVFDSSRRCLHFPRPPLTSSANGIRRPPSPQTPSPPPHRNPSPFLAADHLRRDLSTLFPRHPGQPFVTDSLNHSQLHLQVSNQQFIYTSTEEDPKRDLLFSTTLQHSTRYFPQIKLSYLLASFEVKGGYEVLLADFFVPRNITPEERVRLFVAQSDNMSSSTCIISPCQVNFLINGKGVEKRTNVTMDNGPQFPTDITKMLKYGLNLFQVAGYFNGNHVVAIAVMRAANISDVPELYYVQPDTDTEEGPRVSLNCPISSKRIQTPVKGYLCRHRQCFDFKNYMEMNSGKPSWHCPTCNQSVSYTDIRIDRNMAKILDEAGQVISDVIISADGTWEVYEEPKSNPSQAVNHALAGDHEDPTPSKSTVATNNSTVIVDLTCDDSFEGDVTANKSTAGSHSGKMMLEGNNGNPCESIDRHPSGDGCRFPPESCQTPNIQVHQQISRETLSCSPSNLTLPTRIRRQMLPSPVSAATSIDPMGNDQNRPRAPQIRSSDLQLQQQVGSCNVGNESQRQPIPRHVTRTPVAVQALAASQNQDNSKRPRVGELDFTPLRFDSSSSLSISQPSLRVATSNAVNSGLEMSLFSRAAGLPSLIQQPSLVQPSSTQPRSEAVGLAPFQANSRGMSNNLQAPNGQSINSHLGVKNSQGEHLNTHQTMTQLLNRVSQLPSRPPAWIPQASRNATPNAIGNMANQQNPLSAVQLGNTANQQNPLSAVQHTTISARMQPRMVSPPARTSPMASMITTTPQMTVSRAGPSINEQHESHGSQQTVMRNGSLPELPSDANWRPTGRMRGSLSGAAYSAALSRYVSQPSATQAAASGSSSPSKVPNSDKSQK